MTQSVSTEQTPADASTQQPQAPTVIKGRSLSQIALRRLRRDWAAMVALGVVAFFILVAIFAPLIVKIAGVNPSEFYTDQINVNRGGTPKGKFYGISADHWLGVEPLTGRDLMARLAYGARISLVVALSATVLSVLAGSVFGVVSGYFGGKVDTAISRFMDLLLAFPSLLFIIALTPVIRDRLGGWGFESGSTAWRVVTRVTIISFFGWPYFGRIIRGQTLSLREREFVDAARVVGASSGHILFRQLLPNLWAPVIVYSTLIIPSYIATEAALSFLGVGVGEPTPTWGSILASSVNWAVGVPTYFFFPGTCLFLLVLAFNIFGDGLRDALDPKTGR